MSDQDDEGKVISHPAAGSGQTAEASEPQRPARPRKARRKKAAKKTGKKAGGRKAAAQTESAAKPTKDPKNTACLIHPGPKRRLPEQIAEPLLDLEDKLGMPVCAVINNGSGPYQNLDEGLADGIGIATRAMSKGKRIALVIDSPGGHARSAYRIARLLRKHCGGFVAVVPRWAKSAATLLALGADEIMLGSQGELGPLDVQIHDVNEEKRMSALDEVQSAERLTAVALESFDQTMFLLLERSGKKMDKLVPMALQFTTDLMRPLVDKIDAIHFTQMARALKEGEEYARRLLEPLHGQEKARRIAGDLVERYPEHGFLIDFQEANEIGLQVEELSADADLALWSLLPQLQNVQAVGPLMPVME